MKECENVKKFLKKKDLTNHVKNYPMSMDNQEMHLLKISTELLNNPNLQILEEFEDCLSNFNFSIQIHGSVMYKILKNIDKIQQGKCKPNIKIIILFLIKIMYKQTKLEIGIKSYSYELLIKNDKNHFEEIFIYDLPFISNFKDIKSKILLDFFRNQKDEEDLFNLIFKENRILNFEKIIYKLTDIKNLDFIYSFINYYLINRQREEIETGLDIIFYTFNFLLNELSKGIEKKYIKKIFNYFLNMMLNKKNLKRYKIAGFLLKINLKNIIFNKKKVYKICKKLLEDKSIRIFEISILILSIFDNKYLIKILEDCQDLDKIRIIFKYLKFIDDPIIYKKYLENCKDLRNINFNIQNYPMFAKIYYNFYNKQVIKYINFKKLEITDIYTLDLALNYSKYFPNKIDEEFISSLIFEDSTNLLRNIKIIEILTNINENLTVQIKNQLIEKFKKMIWQSPYTKCIGMFFYKIDYKFSRENCKDDYILVVYAAMNHPDFLRLYSEFVWSTNKLRSLIYILQFKPEFGISYTHKLEEILNSDIISYKYNILEFLNFLILLLDKDLEDEISDFYYKFILKFKNIFYNFLKVQDISIKIQVYKFLYKCVIEKILLKEEVIPLLVIFYKYDECLDIYRDLIIKNIFYIFNLRILEYKKYSVFYDEYFLRNIFKNKKIKVDEDYKDLIEYYVIYINFGEIEIFQDREDLLEKIKKIKKEDFFLQDK
ncbi:armadillo repeat-containing protein [Vairimorpha necatrix]|uniref:Armadillo repeat-containing protein n=1 Tax=Vairimorpha necatrix TaxID=6039 RepID=A0AAX4J999_9MICR